MPYHQIFSGLKEKGACIVTGQRVRNVKLEDIIEICDTALAYEGTLVVAAVAEFFFSLLDVDKTRIQTFQKQLKYGLPTTVDIGIYEIGFSDRTLAQVLSTEVFIRSHYKNEIVNSMYLNLEQVREIIDRYPGYFGFILEEVIRNRNSL